MTAGQQAKRRNKGLLAIAIFKWVKGSALMVASAGALNLLHKNVALHVEHWINAARIDPDNRYMAALLQKLQFVHTRELKQLTALGFFYTALFIVEGTGLAYEQRWAEWLTIIATALFVPVEIYELCREPTLTKGLILLLNVIVVLFLGYLVRHRRAAK